MLKVGSVLLKHYSELLPGLEHFLDPDSLEVLPLSELQDVIVKYFLRLECPSYATTHDCEELTEVQKTAILAKIAKIFIKSGEDEYQHEDGDYVTRPAVKVLMNPSAMESQVREHLDPQSGPSKSKYVTPVGTRVHI
jgi:hypothetical protein